MKSIQYRLNGTAAATAYVLVITASTAAPRPVEELAHKLQDALADYRTVL